MKLTDKAKAAITAAAKPSPFWPVSPSMIVGSGGGGGSAIVGSGGAGGAGKVLVSSGGGPTWKDLMTTPGFHSSKPETWGVAKPASEFASPSEFEREYMGTFTTEEMEMAKKGIDEDRLEPDTDDTMKVLAEQITTALTGAKTKAFMLGEPMHLTIRKKDDSYSKRPHIGGEEFIPVKVYAGKRGTLIYVFKPVEVADYAEMEMGEAQAHEHFSGLKKFMEDLIDRGLSDSVREAKKAAADEEERTKNIGNFEKYADLGYGSF